MSEHELLYLAARAVGYDVYQEGNTWWWHNKYDSDGTQAQWNPLSDDGDALRLMCDLKISVFYGLDDRYKINQKSFGCVTAGQVIAEAILPEREKGFTYENTRIVIVRYAAELGKAIP